MTMPAAGSVAPTFTLDTDEGKPLSLADLRGKPVVLFFYPKDDTPGCTVEACEFRDSFPRFTGIDAVVLGISPDDVASHRKFKKKFDLPFTLLADTEHEVSEAYGVWKQKSMFGHKYMGVDRTTFVIAPDGRIAHVFEKVKPAGHADEVAAAVAHLESPR
jgi:peroxiredoxin Q/BCP